MRRMIAAKDEPSLLEQLAEEYRLFKSQNPRKTARIPASLKQKAKDVHAGGAPAEVMAKALGLSRQGMLRWLEQPTAVTRGRNKRKKSSGLLSRVSGLGMRASALAASSIEPVDQSSKSVKDAAAAAPADDLKWVRIRIGGREIDVARADFWSLLQSAL